jgi:glycosyltransferase involved in cell wall biosynthesis
MNDSANPLVTVVTVTYNSSAYVRDAIESVLSQTYSYLQYIIGDDCSTDNTWEIISGYNDARIEKYRNEANLKEYPNRNKALGRAKGKYIIYIDGDDVILPHGIEYFVRQMEQFPIAAQLIQKGYYNHIIFPALLKPEETLSNHFFGSNDMLSSSLASDFFVTEILQQEKFSEKYISGDDEIRVRLAAKYPTLYVMGWVSWPRETPGQASSKIERDTALEQSARYHEEILLKNQHFFSQELNLSFQEYCKQMKFDRGMLNIRRGNFLKGYQILKNSGYKWPYYSHKKNEDLLRKDFFSYYSPANPYKREYQLLYNN